MKRIILSALVILWMGAMANAQFYVIKDGKVKYALDNTTPDYVTMLGDKFSVNKDNAEIFSLDVAPDEIVFNNPMSCGGIVGEAVDLGLSVKWSSINVGATNPQDYGSYYAWGEIETKNTYTPLTYVGDPAQFIGDGISILETIDDVAAVKWGGDWMMPSNADWEELQNECSIVWSSNYNNTKIAGYIVKSKKVGNTNSIFLPAAGVRHDRELGKENSKGCYWSSTLSESCSREGYSAIFDSDGFVVTNEYNVYRSYGLSVRPVCPSNGNTNGHSAIDLGLPSGKLWAKCNVGANAPQKSGSYFAWGETTEKSDYSWGTYKYIQSGQSDWKYCNKYQVKDCQFDAIWYKNVKYTNNGGMTTIEATDDVATQNWGEEWRLPTLAEWKELSDNTTHTWTEDYNGTGVKGYILTSTQKGYTNAFIFLPAAGISGSSILFGYYWSSTVAENDSHYSYFLHFTSVHIMSDVRINRDCGLTVRPVCSKGEE